MSIFTDNPVLQRELRGRLRLRRSGTSSASLWVAGGIGLVILYFYGRGLQLLWRGPVDDARAIWSYIIGGLLLLLILVAPPLSATAITQEREQQTWELLAVTRLTGGQIILGKWLARQALLGLALLIALPFLVGCAMKGAVPARLTVGALAFLLLTAAFYSLLGLWCSFRTRRTAVATSVAVTLTAALCIGTLIIQGMLLLFFAPWRSGGDGTWQSLPLWVNPFYALGALVGSVNVQAIGIIQPPSEPSQSAVVSVYVMLTLAGLALALWDMILHYRASVVAS